MLRRFSINFALFSMLLDASSVLLALGNAAATRPFLNPLSFIAEIPSTAAIPPALYVLFPSIWLIIYSSLAVYDGRKFLRAVDEFAALSFGMFIAAVSCAGILYLTYRDVSRALFVVFVIQAYLLCLGWRVLARLYFRTQKTSPDSPRRVLIVGAGPLGQKVKRQIAEARTDGLRLVGFVDDAAGGPAVTGPLIGGTRSLDLTVSANQVTDVVVALPYSAYERLSTIVQCLDKLPVRVWVALGFFDLALYKTDIENFAGIPMLDLRASAIDDYQRLVKRAFDISLGGLALLLSLPIMGACALAVVLGDGAPVFFRQVRVGENGRLFEMLKFRTMIRNAEQMQASVARRDENGNLLHKSKEDPRVTAVGRFLRRFSLDELPQLINVVRGDMSLVGPRPEMPYLVEKYQPWQRKRFAVPPGMTGWWQVNGRGDKPMHLHTEDDLYYIDNYSIGLDFQIILKTIWVVLIGRGSY